MAYYGAVPLEWNIGGVKHLIIAESMYQQIHHDDPPTPTEHSFTARIQHQLTKQNKKRCKAPTLPTCYLCGRPYGTRSINIHETQCYTLHLLKWEREDPETRGVKPVDPSYHRALHDVVEDEYATIGAIETAVDNRIAWNDMIEEDYEDNGLVQCPKCHVNIIKSKLRLHLKECSTSRGVIRPKRRGGGAAGGDYIVDTRVESPTSPTPPRRAQTVRNPSPPSAKRRGKTPVLGEEMASGSLDDVVPVAKQQQQQQQQQQEQQQSRAAKSQSRHHRRRLPDPSAPVGRFHDIVMEEEEMNYDMRTTKRRTASSGSTSSWPRLSPHRRRTATRQNYEARIEELRKKLRLRVEARDELANQEVVMEAQNEFEASQHRHHARDGNDSPAPVPTTYLVQEQKEKVMNDDDDDNNENRHDDDDDDDETVSESGDHRRRPFINLVQCKFCKRTFDSKRVEKHQQVCIENRQAHLVLNSPPEQRHRFPTHPPEPSADLCRCCNRETCIRVNGFWKGNRVQNNNNNNNNNKDDVAVEEKSSKKTKLNYDDDNASPKIVSTTRPTQLCSCCNYRVCIRRRDGQPSPENLRVHYDSRDIFLPSSSSSSSSSCSEDNFDNLLDYRDSRTCSDVDLHHRDGDGRGASLLKKNFTKILFDASRVVIDATTDDEDDALALAKALTEVARLRNQLNKERRGERRTM